MNLNRNDPAGTTFQTSINVYDSLGAAHVATLTLKKEMGTGPTPTAVWKFDVTIPNSEIAGTTPGNTDKYSLITGGISTGDPNAGALVFDSTGKLTSAYIGGSAPSTLPGVADLTFPPTGTTYGALANGATLSPTF